MWEVATGKELHTKDIGDLEWYDVAIVFKYLVKKGVGLSLDTKTNCKKSIF